VGEDPGSKADKAKQLGIKTLNEAGFKRLLSGAAKKPSKKKSTEKKAVKKKVATPIKADLIDQKAKKVMYFRIGLYGSGGETVLGKVAKKAYEFWTSEEAEEHFSSYVWGPDWFANDNPDFNIPKFAQLPTWYDMNDIGHVSGAAYDECEIRITEVTQNREVFDGSLRDFLYEYQLGVEWDGVYPDPDKHKYFFYGSHNEKGTFWEGTMELEENFDPTKLIVHGVEIYTDEYITNLEYEGIGYLENEGGGGTDGKSSDFSLIGPDDS
jgi:hypothetical protein